MATKPLHIPIDRFGRIVVPKEIRDRLGLIQGSEFEVEEREDVILLKPIPRQAKLVYQDGLLVVESGGGEKITREQVREALEKVREERSRKLW